MALPQAAACPAQPTPFQSNHVLRIADAVGDLCRPMLALQAVEQLTHPTSAVPHSITLDLLDREALGYLLTVIHLDFQRVVADIENVIQGETV